MTGIGEHVHHPNFARDARVLLANRYQISKIGVMDMFPYTSHLELMALFELS